MSVPTNAEACRIRSQLPAERATIIRDRLRARGLTGLICCGRRELHHYGAVEYVVGECPSGGQAYAMLGAGAPVLLVVGEREGRARSVNAIQVAPTELADALCSWSHRLGMLGRIGTAGSGADGLSVLLPSLQLHDFSEDLAAIKSIKTPAEAAQLQRVAELADDALTYLLEQARTDIHGAVLRAQKMLAGHGARQSIVRLGLGPRFDEQPGTIEFEGMSLLCAYVEVLGANGYWVELMRPLGLGGLDAAEARHLKACAKAAEAARELMSVGITGGQIYAAAARAAREAGLRLDGGCGHGVGIDDQDLPRLVPEDRTVLRKHMAIALHPRLVDDQRGRGLVIGDTYVLSDAGPKRLSRFPPELITVYP